MTETIAPAEVPAAESPHLARHIQDCVDQILAKVNGAPAAG